jgi:hypothetical protein
MAIGAACAAALLSVTGASVARAQPPNPPGVCTYDLSPPRVEQVAGVPTVTATMTLQGCAGPFRPRLSVACVHLGLEGKCAQARDGATAQVFFGPVTPGATYSSSGRGCGTIWTDMTDSNCAPVGPITATL